MFGERLISGIVLVAVSIAVIWLGGLALLVTLMALALIGQFELYRVLKIEKNTIGYMGYMATLLYGILLYFNKGDWLQVFGIVCFLAFMTVYVFTYPQYEFKIIAMAFSGLIYVPVLLGCMYQVRCLDGGFYLVWLIYIAAWGSDTFAYCVGKLIGKHKLSSKLSPKKTIEGCTGGVAGAALLGMLYAWIFRQPLAAHGYTVWHFALAGALGSLSSQIGDLGASAIKRNYEIKDYGKLIPGHGGVMDRFDSILFTAPLAYILFLLVA